MEKKKLKSNKGNYLDGVLLITPNIFEAAFSKGVEINRL